jgi:hypothetical protein
MGLNAVRHHRSRPRSSPRCCMHRAFVTSQRAFVRHSLFETNLLVAILAMLVGALIGLIYMMSL